VLFFPDGVVGACRRLAARLRAAGGARRPEIMAARAGSGPVAP
jgi:hypothetical protein